MLNCMCAVSPSEILITIITTKEGKEEKGNTGSFSGKWSTTNYKTLSGQAR